MKSPRPRAPGRATCAANLDTLTDAPSLILFDIDGTLVLTGGAGGRAMTLAFERLFAIKDAFTGIPMAGRTDAWILADAMAAHGIPPDDVRAPRFRDAYLSHLVEEIAKPGLRKGVMPGVRELLESLATGAGDHFEPFVALLTGNYEAGARVKLEYFDLWRYFRCGAFGDDAPDRNGLLARALTRVSACGGPSFSPSDAVIIGDTPLDIECARLGGARSIGVATGSHRVDELRRAGADLTFEDLADTSAVLQALRRSRNGRW